MLRKQDNVKNYYIVKKKNFIRVKKKIPFEGEQQQQQQQHDNEKVCANDDDHQLHISHHQQQWSYYERTDQIHQKKNCILTSLLVLHTQNTELLACHLRNPSFRMRVCVFAHSFYNFPVKAFFFF